MQSTWEDAHSLALRELVEKGMSFKEVARALNERFGTAYSRNAAIGRARRLGLSTPERSGAGGVFAAPRKPDARKIVEKRILFRSPKPAALARAAVLRLRCVAIAPKHLSLIDLEPDDCRYPYGGDAEGEPITFCGHPRRAGSSYCPSHFHLTSVPEIDDKRPPARAPLRLVEAA